MSGRDFRCVQTAIIFTVLLFIFYIYIFLGSNIALTIYQKNNEVGFLTRYLVFFDSHSRTSGISIQPSSLRLLYMNSVQVQFWVELALISHLGTVYRLMVFVAAILWVPFLPLVGALVYRLLCDLVSPGHSQTHKSMSYINIPIAAALSKRWEIDIKFHPKLNFGGVPLWFILSYNISILDRQQMFHKCPVVTASFHVSIKQYCCLNWNIFIKSPLE